MDTTGQDYQRVVSAAMEAQRRQDAALAKRDPRYRPNPHALPILLGALARNAPTAVDAQDLIDSSLSGRLRGYTITVLGQRHGIRLTR